MEPWAKLGEQKVKEAISVGYMKTVFAHHGIGFDNIGEDEFAIDGTAQFGIAGMRVQLKSTTNPNYTKGKLALNLENKWLLNWAENKVPVILVYLVISNQEATRLVLGTKNSTLKGAAYWLRVDDLARNHLASGSTSDKTCHFPTSQRVTLSTVGQWHDLLVKSFGGA